MRIEKELFEFYFVSNFEGKCIFGKVKGEVEAKNDIVE